MKIGILTLPLHVNHGGILQAYALQCVLQKGGQNEVHILDHYIFSTPKLIPLKTRYLVYLKRFLSGIIKLKFDIFIEHRRRKEYNKAYTTMCCFWKKYMKYSEFHKEYADSYHFDAIVVGSDQVWRPCCAGNPSLYFLDFLKNCDNTNRIAYAASFGVDEWEFTSEQTKICKALSSKFSLLSCRELSGITLCKKHLDIDAEFTLDPTLLLDMDHYISLVKTDGVSPMLKSNSLFAYILDESDEKRKLVKTAAKRLNMNDFTSLSMTSSRFYTFLSITEWLRCFMDAKFIITDSFHGCVFSIIFNKPFYVIGNSERGMARFTSLLKLFELEDRMIDIHQIDSIQPSTDIDWDKVNRIRKSWKEKSLCLLIGALNK